MKQWLLISTLIVGFFVFAQGSNADLGSNESILPKVLKAKTDHHGTFLLVKVSQPKNHEPFKKPVETTSEGWHKHTYTFRSDVPLKITVYSSRVGSLLWKTETSFSINELSLYQKQGSKDIYDFSIRDPHTKVTFEFELNKETSRVRLRAKS
jgi:hypothetical protein